VLLLVVSGVFLWQRGSEIFGQADPVARQYIQAMTAGDVQRARSLTSTWWHQNVDEKVDGDLAKRWSDYQGPIRSIDLQGRYYYTGTSGRNTRLTYHVLGGNHETLATIQLVDEEGRWRVQSCNVGKY